MLKQYSKCLLVFAFCFRYAASIRCFDCNSQNNSMCLDPTIYDNETLSNFLPITECGHGVYSANNDFFCRKIVQMRSKTGKFILRDTSSFIISALFWWLPLLILALRSFNSVVVLHKGYEPEVRVTRSCGWVRHHKACYTADNEDHLETVCQCFDNECNSADTLRSVLVMVVGLLGLKMFL